MNVREKLSLCYYASSTYVRSKGILTVSSGIETADYQRALDEILHQLQEIRDGHWEPWELEGARSTMRSALTSLADSQGALENYCLGQAATGQSEDPETMQRLLEPGDAGAHPGRRRQRDPGHRILPARKGGRLMKTLTYPRIGEKAIWETLPNGLPVCVVPKPGYARKLRLLRHPLRRHGYALPAGRPVAGYPRRHRPLSGAQDVRHRRRQRHAGPGPERGRAQRLHQQRRYRLLFRLHRAFLRQSPDFAVLRVRPLLHRRERGEGTGHHRPGDRHDRGQPRVAGLSPDDAGPVPPQSRPPVRGRVRGEHPPDHRPDPVRLPQGLLYPRQYGAWWWWAM